MPKPDLDNPWIKLSGLQPDATGFFKNPFARMTIPTRMTTPKPASTAPWTMMTTSGVIRINIHTR